MAVPQGAQDVVDAVVATLDADLYDLEFTGGVLRVTLQRRGGIDLDDLADANRRISRALDEADPIPGHYTLEVTSPGLERRLRTDAQWRGAIGERVKVKLLPQAEGERRADGVVSAVDGGSVTILTAAGETRTVSIDAVDKARTVFEWGGQPKPGGAHKPGEPSKKVTR